VFKGIFVTGTDTGVGKTYIGATIATALREYGIHPGVMKPISSGGRSDAKSLIKAAGVTDKMDTVNPIFLKYPLAPMVAARLAGKKLSLNIIWKHFAALKKKYRFVIVEGAGGILVPVSKNISMLNLIKKFSLPVVVVGKPSLGTINHTLLTVDKLRCEKVKIAGIVISGRKNSTLAEKTNPGILRELTNLPVLEVPSKAKINLKQNPWLIGL